MAALRLGVVAGMFMAVHIVSTTHWRAQLVLLTSYLATAVFAAVRVFWVRTHTNIALRVQFGLPIVDVAVMFTYEQLAPPTRSLCASAGDDAVAANGCL